MTTPALDPTRLTKVWLLCRPIGAPLTPRDLEELRALCPDIIKKEPQHYDS